MRVRKLQSDKYVLCYVAVVSACGGGGCIVMMRWIVVATIISGVCGGLGGLSPQTSEHLHCKNVC